MDRELNVFKNKKTGEHYTGIGLIKNATNGFEDQDMVLYYKGNAGFCREKKEFFEKFEMIGITTNG